MIFLGSVFESIERDLLKARRVQKHCISQRRAHLEADFGAFLGTFFHGKSDALLSLICGALWGRKN